MPRIEEWNSGRSVENGGMVTGITRAASETDSESMMNKADQLASDYQRLLTCWKHPKIQSNWRLLLASWLLTLAGLGTFLLLH